MKNPWIIQSIYELQYYNCPSCVFKNPSKQEFIDHAYEIHPESHDCLSRINDNSLSDVTCPWNEISMEIKQEEYNIPDEPNDDPQVNEAFVDLPKEELSDEIIEPNEHNDPLGCEALIEGNTEKFDNDYEELINFDLQKNKNRSRINVC